MTEGFLYFAVSATFQGASIPEAPVKNGYQQQNFLEILQETDLAFLPAVPGLAATLCACVTVKKHHAAVARCFLDFLDLYVGLTHSKK